MTDDRKTRSLARGWAAVERELANDAVDLETADDAAVERELRAAGIAPAEADAIFERALARATRPTPARSSRRRAIVVAAVFAALGGAVLVTSGPPVAGTHDRPDARRLREAAARDCRDARWDACAAELDEARAIDPRGEDAEDVRAMRAAIAHHG